jgi:hypothetical protein
MQAMTIDPDLGKAVFQVHDVDASGGQWAGCSNPASWRPGPSRAARWESQWEQSTPMKMPRRSRSPPTSAISPTQSPATSRRS